MRKHFRRAFKDIPIEDIKRALCLLRYRAHKPDIKSMAYLSLKRCADELGLSVSQARRLLMQEVSKNSEALYSKRIITRSRTKQMQMKRNMRIKLTPEITQYATSSNTVLNQIGMTLAMRAKMLHR